MGLSCQLTTVSMERLVEQLNCWVLRGNAQRTVELIWSSLRAKVAFFRVFHTGLSAQTFRLPQSLRRLGSIEAVRVHFEFLRPLACSEW
jgi:hypothetical protein